MSNDHCSCHMSCSLLYIIRKHSQSRVIERTLTLEKERVQAKIMNQIGSSEGRKIIRMGPKPS